MSRSFLHLRSLTYRWPSQEESLFSNLSTTFEAGWTGIIGENGSGKSTLLRLITGELSPLSGEIVRPSAPEFCRQRTDEPPGEFQEFSYLSDASSGRLASRLNIGPDWYYRWDTLSHGERKRAQIATALWKTPEVILVDEPANHLDSESRDLLADLLAGFSGIGLIVSHDRSLLDRLCSRCLFLESGGAVMRPGGVSDGLTEMEKEELAAVRERDEALREFRRIRNEAGRRSREAAAADRKRSKRNIDPADHDAKATMDLARLTGKDGRAGALKKQMDARMERARSRLDAAAVRRRVPGGVTLNGGLARSDRLVRMASGSLSLGDRRILHWPDLEVLPADRIALVGSNGSGKSRFLSRLLESPDIRRENLLYIPQEIDTTESRRLVQMIRSLPKDVRGEVFSAVDRLGSNPVRLLESELPSPGEVRKLMLARGLGRGVSWIVMDEPTNHMDLFSLRHLEAALDGFSGALLLVSHDLKFLENLTDMDWVIAGDCLGLRSH